MSLLSAPGRVGNHGKMSLLSAPGRVRNSGKMSLLSASGRVLIKTTLMKSPAGLSGAAQTVFLSKQVWTILLAEKEMLSQSAYTLSIPWAKEARCMASLVPRPLWEKSRRGLVTQPYSALSQRNSISHATTH